MTNIPHNQPSGQPTGAVAAPDHPDVEILALEAKLDEADQAGRVAAEASDEEAEKAANERWREALRQIAALPACTVDGVAVKARRLIEVIEHGPTEFDEQVARTALADLERLSGKQAVIPPQASDAVAAWGRALARNWEALIAADEKMVGHKDKPSPEHWRLERAFELLGERKEAFHGMIALSQATSLEGVLVQVILAHGMADAVGACGDAQCDQCKDDLKRISAALHSAINVIEKAAACDRAEFHGEAYLGPRVDLPVPPTGDPT